MPKGIFGPNFTSIRLITCHAAPRASWTHSKDAPRMQHVTFGLNVWLDLSWEATTESLRLLKAKPMLQVLSESTWTLTIGVIRGDEGVGDIPGVRGGFRGACRFCAM